MAKNEDKIVSLLQEGATFAPPVEGQDQAHIKSLDEYKAAYKRSIEDPEGFWADRAEELVTWDKKWDKVLEYDFSKPEIEWFKGGKLNMSVNCLDRHLTNGRRNKAALIWQGEPEEDVKVYTYQMLHTEVCRFANVLKKKGVKKGDRVSIYLPMVPELSIALLACARIGAIHSVVFAGFSAVALQSRIQDCEAKVLITADAVLRSGKVIPLKPNADSALKECSSVESCIVVERAGNDVTMQEGRDSWWHEEVTAGDISSECEPESMDAEDTLFILYTSGSTGTPKGVVHTTGGYLTYAMHTTQWVFDLKDDDVYWCTADIGWITGHSYILYGPLGLGATSLMFEGVPSYPGPDRFWKIVEKFRVNIFYTAPTVIRALMREGEEPVQRYDLSSLRILGSVGEPINPEAWMWYHVNIGKEKLPIVDTWWQTETGGIMISPLPYATTLKPGSATYPLPGIDAAIYDEDGNEAAPNEGGHLVIRKPWPGMLRGVYKNPERFKKTYFSRYENTYDPEDGARKDEDGCFWIMGRLDDVINVSGHRLGTAEIESALVSHEAVAEAAVVGMPHPVKGQTIFAYVTLMSSVEESDELLAKLRKHVRAEIGPIATPEVIMWAPGLPKTRSGKIMRRILRKIAADDFDNFGDTSTLADPSVVDNLVEGRKSM
ncbi:MAG: acetate--CoA ligase [Candidatus Electrothrix aestuarii]|uniref:Acetyl-coenzyme A synthetase n=1 Tax=Candidatus Electrothrix aestuarii TaxID=3062594 RepID=A0AAU8LWL4_9BACT|nr:acetate--CoA ligase [Candidatus Electrothrix aestuarii]WPD22188.1 MAG: acetate--CoA ligase [Candidatus Electrothrix sp. GW3-3]